jgi:hypothetical protein
MNALAERDAQLGERVRAHLLNYGATTARDLAANVGIGIKQVCNHLRKHTDKYVHLMGAHPMWGLVGIDYEVKVTLPQYVHIFRATLEKYGPLTVVELCRLSGIQKGSATVGMARYTDIFVQVTHTVHGRQKAAIWGLVGIHDQGEAA